MDKTVIKKQVSRYWLPAAVILAAIVRILMVNGLPINPMPGAACDDQLLKYWAYTMISGEWTGSFDAFTFVKEVGFSIFLAICFRLHIPYLFAISLIYTVGTGIFAWALRRIISNRYVWFGIFLVILFNPVSYAAETTQRVYRNGLGLALTLWVFGCILNLYFSILDEKMWKPVLWSFLTGASLGFLWIVKNDTIWLLPFVITVLLITAGLLLFQRRKKSSVILAVCLLLPFAGIWVCTSFVSYMNVKTYGSNGIPYYGLAFGDMTSVLQEEEVNSCSMTRATFERLCEVSPTLNSVKDVMLQNMDLFDVYDTNPGDGNLEDGWLGWAFVSAIQQSGYYSDCETANAFYEKVYSELESAYQSGQLERRSESRLASFHLDTQVHRKEFVDTIGEIFTYVASFQEVSSRQDVFSAENVTGVLSFENLTRNHAAYEPGDHDYYLSGWIFYPGYDLSKLDVYVEDEAGNRYEALTFAKSEDVGGTYEGEASAANCRFVVEWDKKDNTAGSAYVLCAYEGDNLISKVAVSASGFTLTDGSDFQGSVDTYIDYIKADTVYQSTGRAVERLNHIADIYKFAGIWVNGAGILAYILFTVGFVLDLRKKCYQNVNAWLVVTGILLSLMILFIGVTVTHLEQCPAIGYMYLSSGYALLMTASLVSIYQCALWIVRLRRK